MLLLNLIYFLLSTGHTRLSRGPSFTQRSSPQSCRPHLWPLRPLSVWPPRSGRPGSRWAGVWDISTRWGQLWLAAFLCGWTMTERVIRAVWGGPLFGFLLRWGLTGAAGPMHRVPIIHVRYWHYHPAFCCAGIAAPTATYCTIKYVEGHDWGQGTGWMESFPAKYYADLLNVLGVLLRSDPKDTLLFAVLLQTPC